MRYPSFVAWVGASSFDVDTTDPWRCLLSKNSKTDAAINSAWLHMKTDYFETCNRANRPVATDSLFQNGPESAGFDHEGNMIKGSVTRRLTSILKTARYKLPQTSVEKITQDGSLFTPTDRERLVLTQLMYSVANQLSLYRAHSVSWLTMY